MADGLRPYGVLDICFDLDGSWRHEPGDMRCGKCGWEPETPMVNVEVEPDLRGIPLDFPEEPQ